MIKVNDWLQKVYIPLQEGWGYIWGTSGQVWTAKSKISSSAPASSKTNAAKYGSKWYGKRVTDCSGLLYWAAKQLGVSIPHGASSIMKGYTSASGKISSSGAELKPGYAVFQRRSGIASKPWNHVGVYVGNGVVIEATGTQAGVVTSGLDRWDEWGALKFVDYADAEALVLKVTLQTGSKGDAVKVLQQNLLALGYTLPKYGADGSFGNETLAAVKAFQADHGLIQTGIVDEDTQAAIDAALADVPEPELEPDLLARVAALEAAVKELQEKLSN